MRASKIRLYMTFNTEWIRRLSNPEVILYGVIETGLHDGIGQR